MYGAYNSKVNISKSTLPYITCDALASTPCQNAVMPRLISSPCTSPYGRVRVVHTSMLPHPTPIVSSILAALVLYCVHRMSRPPDAILCPRAPPVRIILG